MNDLVYNGNTNITSPSRRPEENGHGYGDAKWWDIAVCCGARLYNDVLLFRSENQGVGVIVNPDKPIPAAPADSNYRIERLQLGEDSVVLKLRIAK